MRCQTPRDQTCQQMALAMWAKSRPFHSLLAHMLDSAAVSVSLLRREPRRTQTLYAQDWSLSTEEAITWAGFLVGLHDLGKASPTFQAVWPEGSSRVREAGLSWDEERVEDRQLWVAHGVFTELYVREILEALGLSDRVARALAQALAAHHGFLAQAPERKTARLLKKMEPPLWVKARSYLVNNLREAMSLPRLPEVNSVSPAALLRIMALASFADWIASDATLFPYGRNPEDAEEYWRESLARAEDALVHIRWETRHLPVPEFDKVFGFAPNRLQRAVQELLKNATTGPILLLIEAPMGVGKTEAALYAHLILQERLDHRGLYLALPTQATANGLFLRVKSFLDRIAPAPLDLQLQFGMAALNPQYKELLEDINPAQVLDDGPSDGAEGAVRAAAWLSARKRAMLSFYGVGTVDQALLGVLRVKHHFIRLWGLMNRTVVLDEIHAYDAYTSGLLKGLLRWLYELSSTVILMTATLPRAKRRELLEAWGAEANEELPDYPRATIFSDGRMLGARTFAIDRTHNKALQLNPLTPDLDVVADRLRGDGVQGAILNTVDRAQGLYHALGEGQKLTLSDIFGELGARWEGPWSDLRESFSTKGDEVVGKRLPDGTLVFLLHARFPAEQRALREAVVVALFGRHGPRPGRAILVATQVAEQSLDVDFDLLYTDLAPVDLLLQRAGRLCRHPRNRPHENSPTLLVGGLLGESPAFGDKLYWDRVYEAYILLSTWLSLKDRQTIVLPDELEPLLEEVYGRTPEDFPESLRKKAYDSYREFQQNKAQEEALARNVALQEPGDLLGGKDLTQVARLDDEADDDRTRRFLTRLGSPSIPVIPLFRQGHEAFLDSQLRRRVTLEGEVSREEILALWGRAVLLGRFPLPKVVTEEEQPKAWGRCGLLKGVRPLWVGEPYRYGGTTLRVLLDPELGIVYESCAD